MVFPFTAVAAIERFCVPELEKETGPEAESWSEEITRAVEFAVAELIGIFEVIETGDVNPLVVVPF